jgi:succinyl-CoA synthetase alpha subunit
MPILVDSSSKVLFQGVYSESDIYQIQQCIAYGTKVMGAVHSPKRGQEFLGRPFFGTVEEAKKKTDCNVSLLFTPPEEAKEALLEAVCASIPLIICLCEEVPIHDMVEVLQVKKSFPAVRLIGPHSSGLLTPGQCMIGRMPGYIFKDGCVGILSSSGSLMYEAVLQTTKKELGQSTCLVQGLYPLVITPTIDILELFYKDVVTEVIMILGEIDPNQEEEIIDWMKRKPLKPIIACLTGGGEAHLKTRLSFAKAGALVVENITKLGDAAYKALRT